MSAFILNLLWASLLFGMVKYWWPWCCCGTAPPCGFCTADAETVSLAISGIVDGTTCNLCSALNGTYILNRTVTDPCLWKWYGKRFCSLSYLGCQWEIRANALDIVSTGVEVGWDVGLSFFCPDVPLTEGARYIWDSDSTDDFDCTAEHSLTVLSYPAATGCSGWDVLTITIN